jgi:carbon-monoxide dehydrogenase medium subunit
MIRPFDLRRPSALGEVGALLGEYGDAAALYAGGTELLLLMKEGFLRPRVLVDVKRVPGLDRVTAAADGIEIGATASHGSVERSEAMRAHAPLVAGVARHVANVRVRSVGTVGGNLAFADPHSDLATLFLVFDARVVLWSLAGERELPLADFVLGPYETARRDDEILTAVRLRPWRAGTVGTYLKFGVHERPTLGVAAVLTPGADRETVADARVAIGCIGPRPERLGHVETRLHGAAIADIAQGRTSVTEAAADAIDAITDLHGAADYKREMAQVFLRRALRIAASRAVGEPVDGRYPHTVVVQAG